MNSIFSIKPFVPVVGFGCEVGLRTLEGLIFEPAKPYSGCKICGDAYQSNYDRNPEAYVDGVNFYSLDMVRAFALGLRKEWTYSHQRTHPSREHLLLKMSGRWCTPEAAQRLAALGVIPIVDMIMDDETEDALYESKPIPTDDVEGT